MEQARHAITEGRDAVQGLRLSTVGNNDLAHLISTSENNSLPLKTTGIVREFRLLVEGKARDLPPLVRDEAYRTTCEALRNAFRHAHAGRIEVEIRYDQRQLRLRVGDNGRGLTRTFLPEAPGPDTTVRQA